MSASIMDILGARIAELRKAQGWSQAKLADEIGASREIIGRYERGDAGASIEMAKRIADAFGVSLDYLVGEGEYARFDKRMLQRLGQFEELGEEDQATVLRVLDALLRDAEVRRAYSS